MWLVTFSEAMMTTVTVIYQRIIKPSPAGLGQPNRKHLLLRTCGDHKRMKHKMLVSLDPVPSIRDQFHSNPVDSKVGKTL